MILASKSNQGFTLVELLVVMFIGIMATSLVGGLVVDSVRKYRTKAEILTATGIVKKVSDSAFVKEQSASVLLSGNQITIRWQNKKQQLFSFEHIFFPEKEISVSPSGMTNINAIEVNTGSATRMVSLGAGK